MRTPDDQDDLATIVDAALVGQDVRPGPAIGVLRAVLAPLLHRPGARADVDPEIAALVRLAGAGFGDAPGDALSLELSDLIARGEDADRAREALPDVLQAYVRAVGRIAGAEAETARRALAGVEAAQRPALLRRIVGVLLPVGDRGFRLLHATFLREALFDALRPELLDQDAQPALAVALVDLVGSTAHLAGTEPEQLEELIDALFRSGQEAASSAGVRAVKYVGDGVFLTGGDVPEVASAAQATITALERALPLRARAGIAHGPVSRRAGDIFGLPVNVAQLLTKRAPPGGTLLDADSAARLPAERLGEARTLEIHPALPPMRVVTLAQKL